MGTYAKGGKGGPLPANGWKPATPHEFPGVRPVGGGKGPPAGAPIGAAAKRQKVSALLVTASEDQEVQGVEVLLGRFEQTSRTNANQPVFEKISILSGKSSNEDGPCFLYPVPSAR